MSDADESLLPLTPPQVSAQHYAARPFTLGLETPLPVTELLARMREVLDGTPALRLASRRVPGVRVLRQSPQPVRVQNTPEGDVVIVAGALTATLSPSPHGSRLRLAGDWGLLDRPSLQGFTDALAGAAVPPAEDRLAAVVTAYAQMAKDGELAEEENYWSGIAAQGERDPLQLLDDEAESPEQPSSPTAPHSATVELAPGTRQALDATARKWNTTAPDIAYLALSLLVSGLVERPLLGRVCDARPTLGLDGHPGAFTQVLPDLPALEPDMSLEEAARRQDRRTAEHRAKAGGAALSADSARPVLVFEPGTAWELPAGWRLDEWFLAAADAVTVRIVEADDRLVLQADALDGTWDRRLEELLAAWRCVLENVVDTPDGSCRDAQPMASAERTRLADALMTPVVDKPHHLCQAVHAHALADPDIVAFRTASIQVSRGDLARSIAGVVRELEGIEQGAVVGVLAENGLDLLVGWLAVLWRGAVVLPLSPEEPRQRLEDALAATGAVALLHQGGHAAQAERLHARTYDLAAAAAEGEAHCGPPAPCPGEAPAYLIRTSGSTGEPKIVAVTRDNLDNYLRGIASELDLGSRPLPWVSAPVFDAGLKQFLGPQYVGGATVALASARADVDGIARELAAFGEDFELNCVPGYWSALLDAFPAGTRPPLVRLLLGGEPVSARLLARTAEEFPDTEVWNLYGPTETTATATAGRLLPGSPVDVGAPVAGARVLIADRWGRLVPEGFPGEVWVAGPGVAAGYLSGGRVVPFGTATVGGREIPVYRTGDLGFLAGGRLHLAGRMDRQVKIRGWRVDPLHLESVAEKLGRTRARVVVRGGDGASLHLFHTGPVTVGDMTSHLRAQLPPALMPTITQVPAFPVTPTGKLDEQRLLDAMEQAGKIDPDTAYTPAERAVAQVWRELLKGEWPSPEGDFFASGGHSLVLARMVNILRTEGHERLTIKAAVRKPTVRALAGLLDLPAS